MQTHIEKLDSKLSLSHLSTSEAHQVAHVPSKVATTIRQNAKRASDERRGEPRERIATSKLRRAARRMKESLGTLWKQCHADES